MTRAEFLDAAYDLCQKYRASTTSWFRTDAHNKAVGGVPHSPHRFGLAVDVTYDTPLTADQKTMFIEDAKRLGIFVLPEGDHDHLQPADWKAG
jgi:Peptidase M15